MNAPLPDAIRKALETITLKDNPRSGLHHNDTAHGTAGRGGFGVEHAPMGGVL